MVAYHASSASMATPNGCTRLMQDGEAPELAAGQRQSPAAAAAQDQELVRGPLNGTKLNGAPKNSALNGVKINGTHVSRLTSTGIRLMGACQRGCLVR
jgi:hypothetical protein